ncbi:MAG TPA: hypothetical protein VE621_14815, partial [Bryobacteraceae bacterium]|nr:hypothetical protein [Bryobacteraceae bacterium]
MMRSAVLAGALLLIPNFAQAAGDNKKPQVQQLSKLEDEIRHELVMMPWYGVFDQISFKVDGR